MQFSRATRGLSRRPGPGARGLRAFSHNTGRVSSRPISRKAAPVILPAGAKVVGRVRRGTKTVEAYRSGTSYYYVSRIGKKRSTLFVVQVPASSSRTASPSPAAGGSVLGIPIPIPGPLASAVSALVKGVLSGGAAGMNVATSPPYVPLAVGIIFLMLGAMVRRFAPQAA